MPRICAAMLNPAVMSVRAIAITASVKMMLRIVDIVLNIGV